ncbi:MAG TPA: hypothetical protein VF476_10690 [Chitinophagaceae bacterium]
MKKTMILSAVTLLFTAISLAQVVPAPKTLKKVLELKMPKTADDDMPGTRGASVAWHPVLKKYYAAFAGNVGYPLAVFDATGKRLSGDDQKTFFDIRGMWYNPTSKTIQANGYDDFGWGEYKLDAKGIPTDIEVLFDDMNQPTEQSTGIYSTREKMVYFFNGEGNLDKYDISSAEVEGSVTLHLGKTKASDDFENADVVADYNTAAAYTDLPGSEIALLNHYEKRIELYSIRTGYKTKELKLPESAPVEATFNFAYCNGTYWLFDMKTRTWKGFK